MVPNLPPSLPGWAWQKRFRHCARRCLKHWMWVFSETDWIGCWVRVIVSGRTGFSLCPTGSYCCRCRRNIGLWAEPAANAPSHCKNGGMDAEHCAISAMVHGVQQIASNAPYGGIAEGDAGLHDSVDYATIVEVDSQNYKLQAHEHKTQYSCPCGAKVVLCVGACLSAGERRLPGVHGGCWSSPQCFTKNVADVVWKACRIHARPQETGRQTAGESVCGIVAV